jgi:hypothetical protein
MTQRRAKKGGEYGVNGEWYEGGKYIANTNQPKRFGSRKATGKQEIAPYIWEAPPQPGLRAIFSKYSSLWAIVDGKAVRHPTANPMMFDLDEAEKMAQKWNEGERWH